MELLYIIYNVGIVRYFFSTKYESQTGDLRYETPIMYIISSMILVFFIAYLLGSLNFATLISRKKYKEDIREHGSGNAGMTNMMRTYGTKAAVLTLLGDALKTFIAILIGYIVMGKDGAYIAGLGAVIGHTFPLYYKFKGGKGVVTAAVTILCTDFWVGLILIVLFVAIVIATKYISLGSIMGVLIYPVILSNFGKLSFTQLICCFGITILIVFNHRSNIKRLLNGEENKFSFKKSK